MASNNNGSARASRRIRNLIARSEASLNLKAGRSQLPSSVPGPEGSVRTYPIDIVSVQTPVSPGDTVHIVAETISDAPDTPGAALLQIIARSSTGERIPIPGWPHRSARVDEYEYLQPGDAANPAVTAFTVTVPDGARHLELIGHKWKAAVTTALVGQLLIHTEDSGLPPFSASSGARITWPAPHYVETFDIPSGASTADISVLVEGTADAVNSPLIVSYLDDKGNELMPPDALPQNAQNGAYIPLSAGPHDQSLVERSIDIPCEARQLRLAGLKWGKKTANLASKPAVDFRREESFDEVLKELLSTPEQPLIVIDTTAPPLGHATLSLRPNNLSIEYARSGAKVLFIPFSTIQDQSPRPGPSLAQVDRVAAGELIEKLVVGREGCENYYICSSFPSLECVTRCEYLQDHSWTTVYEVRDDMEEFNRVGYSAWYHPLLEHKILRVADLVVTVSQALSRKMQTMHPEIGAVHTVPNGVSGATLEGAAPLRDPALLGSRNSSRTVGYVGHLTPSWFDWPLVIEAAKNLPDITFDIIGHGKPDNITLPDNVNFIGPMSHEELLPLARTWKVGLIPFIPTPLTRGVDPNKIYEYFAWGLRVVSAPMGSVDKYPSTFTYRTTAEFVDRLREAVDTELTADELHQLTDFADASHWKHRAGTMLNLMKGARA